MLKIKNLSKIYNTDNNQTIALDNVSFTLPKSGMVFVVGKSGCGKTTLLNIIGGLDNLTNGDVFINDKGISKFSEKELDNYRNSTIGFIFQDFCLIDGLNVKQNIQLSLNFKNEKQKIDIDSVLDKVGLKGLSKRYPKQLSAGQKQRVSIARAIIKSPEIILADEPTGNVDDKTSKQILDLLKEISKTTLVMIISHNQEEAYQYADRIIEMHDGKIISDKILNNDASDTFYIDNTKAIIPGNGFINEQQLEELNSNIKNSKGNFCVFQHEEKFIAKDNFENKEYKIKTEDVKMNTLSKVKYSSFFFKKNFVFNLFIILLIVFVTSVFSVTQNIAFVDNNDEFLRISNECKVSDISFNEYFGESCKPISDINSLNEKAKNYNIEVDPIYNISMNFSSSANIYNLYHPLPTYKTYNDIYVNGSNGICITTRKKLEQRYNNLNVLAGSINEKGLGVIITDYLADSIINNSNYNSYSEIVNTNTLFNDIYVDAIIETNYEKTFENEIENVDGRLNKNDGSIYYNLSDSYSNLYSLNPNFIDEYIDFNQSNPNYKCKIYHASFNGIDGDISMNYLDGRFNTILNKGEIKLSFTKYNSLFSTKYNNNNYDDSTFVPTDITFKIRNGYASSDKQLSMKVVGLYDPINTYDSIVFSSLDYYEIVSNQLCITTGNIIINNCNDEARIFDFLIDNNLSSTYVNKNNHLIISTLNLYETFKNVFKYISYLLFLSIFFIIILNANIIIKQNVYEIGLMRALGAKTKEIVLIFAMQMIFTSICVCFLLFFGSHYVIGFADNMLKAGTLAYLGNLYDIYFNTLVFNNSHFLLNIMFISIFTIISIITPLMTIRKIKPLKIIKSRN